MSEELKGDAIVLLATRTEALLSLGFAQELLQCGAKLKDKQKAFHLELVKAGLINLNSAQVVEKSMDWVTDVAVPIYMKCLLD